MNHIMSIAKELPQEILEKIGHFLPNYLDYTSFKVTNRLCTVALKGEHFPQAQAIHCFANRLFHVLTLNHPRNGRLDVCLRYRSQLVYLQPEGEDTYSVYQEDIRSLYETQETNEWYRDSEIFKDNRLDNQREILRFAFEWLHNKDVANVQINYGSDTYGGDDFCKVPDDHNQFIHDLPVDDV